MFQESQESYDENPRKLQVNSLTTAGKARQLINVCFVYVDLMSTIYQFNSRTEMKEARMGDTPEMIPLFWCVHHLVLFDENISQNSDSYKEELRTILLTDLQISGNNRD